MENEKLVCNVKEDKFGGEIFLFKYINGIKQGHIWVYTFASRDISKKDRIFLDQINGTDIHEGDPRYKQIYDLSRKLEDLNYNPLMSFAPQSIIKLNCAMFEILRSFLTIN